MPHSLTEEKSFRLEEVNGEQKVGEHASLEPLRFNEAAPQHTLHSQTHGRKHHSHGFVLLSLTSHHAVPKGPLSGSQTVHKDPNITRKRKGYATSKLIVSCVETRKYLPLTLLSE